MDSTAEEAKGAFITLSFGGFLVIGRPAFRDPLELLSLDLC